MILWSCDNLLVLILTFGVVDRVDSVQTCLVPSQVSDILTFEPTAVANIGSNTTEQVEYVLSCKNAGRVVFPLDTQTTVVCKGDVWKTSTQDFKIFSLEDLKCVLVCSEPIIAHGRYQLAYEGSYVGPIRSRQFPELRYFPGIKVTPTCDAGYILDSLVNYSICTEDGEWLPPTPQCIDPSATTTKDMRGTADSLSDDTSSKLIYIIVGITVFVLFFLSMLIVLAIKARWRLVCRKRRVPASHPDDRNYPRGYTQLGSGPLLPSYAEATEDAEEEDFRSVSHFGPICSVYRPTVAATRDYRQLSSMESSSRGDTESLSASSHRHSLFSGSSGQYYRSPATLGCAVGDNFSDILLTQGDHLSMSDNSTLVTVNTYESNTTASNPSLTHSRHGVAGSMSSNTATSMDGMVHTQYPSINHHHHVSTDDAPLIVRSTAGVSEEDIQSSQELPARE